MSQWKNLKTVLVAVLKNKRDFGIFKKNLWYRIPVRFKPKRKIKYIAFYQPLSFDKTGSCIRYFSRVKNNRIIKRIKLLPEEPTHINANKNYYKIYLDKIQKLKKPITNKNRLRIAFGFTTMKKLLKAKEVIELFDIQPIEKILSGVLKSSKINYSQQFNVKLSNNKRYRLDFTVFCKKGHLNIECDGEKWHSISSQKQKDIKRDRELIKLGWNILRLNEKEIVYDTKKCIKKIKDSIKKLGGV